MQSNGLTMRWGEVAAVVAWLIVAVLVLADTIRGQRGLMSMWAVVLSPAASAISYAAWGGRRCERHYQRGLDEGLATANIIKLSDHERV